VTLPASVGAGSSFELPLELDASPWKPASSFGLKASERRIAGFCGLGAFGNAATDCAPAGCRHSSRQEIATIKRTAYPDDAPTGGAQAEWMQRTMIVPQDCRVVTADKVSPQA
jgi:hypothetical protein